MRILTSFTILLLLIGCSSERTFEVDGRVAGFGDDPRTLIVEHNEIEGYMPAMTMPFRVSDPASIESLHTGDPISFQLNVSSDSSWINQIESLPEDAVDPSPAGEQLSEVNQEDRLVLDRGEAVPPFSLVNQHEEPISEDIFGDRPYVVTFIYTRCPLPDYCPLISQRFRELQSQIEQRYDDNVGLLSISVDPEFDTPAVLRDYAEEYNANPDIWTLATGEPSEVRRMANYMGVFYREHESSEEEVLHNLSTAVIDESGRLKEVWRGSDWSTGEIIAAIDS